MRALQAENRVLREALHIDAPTPPPAAVTPAPAPATDVNFGGLVQAQAEAGDRIDSRYADDHARVFLRRARLNASGKFSEAFDFKVELDLAGSLSNATAMRAQMTDGYVTWTHFPSATIRVGQFKTPFGYEQLVADPRLPTPERTLGSDRMTPGRQLGVQFAGDLLGKRMAYAVGAFNGTGSNSNFNDNGAFLTAGRISGTIYDDHHTTLELGANAFTTTDRGVTLSSDFDFDSTPETAANDDLFFGRRNAWGANARFASGPFEAWAELLRMTTHPTDRIPSSTVRSSSANLTAMMMATQKLQLVARYDTFAAIRGTDAIHSWLGGVNYLIRGNDLKLQLHVVRSDNAGDSTRVIARVQTAF